MLIHGLQKMTLLDFPGKVACTVFLGGCDFRCPFCHNSELLDASAPALMEDGELLDFLSKRRGLLDGVAITGGEPLLRTELPELLKRIRDLGFSVKLDTNGSHPDRLARLLSEGLVDYTAMDIKNSPERYREIIGRPDFDIAPILESISLLIGGAADYEFRTTVVKEYHDDASFTAIGPMIRGAKRYFLQCYTDRDTVPDRSLTPPTAEELEHFRSLVLPYVPNTSLRGV